MYISLGLKNNPNVMYSKLIKIISELGLVEILVLALLILLVVIIVSRLIYSLVKIEDVSEVKIWLFKVYKRRKK